MKTDHTPSRVPIALILDEETLRRIVREEVAAAMKQNQLTGGSESNASEGRHPKEWMTNKEAMEYLGLSRMTLQRYRDNGVIEYAKIGSNIYYERRAILKLLRDNTMMSIK